MEPIKKSTVLKDLADSVFEEIFGMKMSHAIKNCVCVDCKQPARTFKDRLSQKEYFISGLCQKCQDELFAEDFVYGD